MPLRRVASPGDAPVAPLDREHAPNARFGVPGPRRGTTLHTQLDPLRGLRGTAPKATGHGNANVDE